MKCDCCGESIPPGEEMNHFGQTLCEGRFMHALSPACACDLWAVRSAQTLSKMDESYSGLSESQLSILRVFQETGGIEANVIAERLQMKLPELERKLATLRHMEKIRSAMRAGKKIVCLWEAQE